MLTIAIPFLRTTSYTFDAREWDKGCSYKSLFSISSSREQDFVLSLLADLDTDVWIGLTRTDVGDFRWVNGDKMTSVYRSVVAMELVI